MFRSSFRVPTVRFSKNGDENLTGVTRKPDKKQRLKMVLNTRDIEDSGTIFGFPVSNHKKKYCTFEFFWSKIGPIWRFGRLEPLCAITLDC